MALPPDTYRCDIHNGIAACIAKSPSAESVYRALATRLRVAYHQMRSAGVAGLLDPPVSTTIGPTLVLSAQNVLGALALVAAVPAPLQGLFDPATPPPQLIAIVGAYADDITAYIDQVCMAYPDAFTRARAAATAPPEPLGAPVVNDAKRFFTKDRVIGIGVALISLGGIAYLAHASDRRQLGRTDRSRLLPRAPGEEDDGDDGDDDYEDEPDDVPPAGVIDVESRVVQAEPGA